MAVDAVISVRFQSTLSVRRATRALLELLQTSKKFQSTLSVRRATLMRTEGEYIISIFQSTLSVRRATQLTILQYFCCRISIHALREESDTTSQNTTTDSTNFNPRSP